MKPQTFIFTLAIIILTLGCKSEELKPTEETKRYLALGDSYTIGEGVLANERYPVQLTDSLNKLDFNVDEPQIVARTGWTTSELSNGIDNASINPPYDLVTLLIGVNNQYRGLSIDNYRIEFQILLNRAISFADGNNNKVIVISIPDWGVTPFAQGRDREKIAREIDAFNLVNFEESLKLGVAYVDVTGISREAENRPELLAPDGLHPSGIMYGLWVEKIVPIALQIFNQLP